MAIRFAYALARPQGYADGLWKRIRERRYYYPQKYVAQLRCASVLSLLLLRLPLLALYLFHSQVILMYRLSLEFLYLCDGIVMDLIVTGGEIYLCL